MIQTFVINSGLFHDTWHTNDTADVTGTALKRGCYQAQTTSSIRCDSWKERPTFWSYLPISYTFFFFFLAILENFSFVSFWSLFLWIPFLCSEQSDTLNGLEREESPWSAQSHSYRPGSCGLQDAFQHLRDAEPGWPLRHLVGSAQPATRAARPCLCDAGRPGYPRWAAVPAASRRAVGGRRPVCRRRHGRARGSDTGLSAALTGRIHTRAPRHTGSSSAGCLVEEGEAEPWATWGGGGISPQGWRIPPSFLPCLCVSLS